MSLNVPRLPSRSSRRPAKADQCIGVTTSESYTIPVVVGLPKTMRKGSHTLRKPVIAATKELVLMHARLEIVPAVAAPNDWFLPSAVAGCTVPHLFDGGNSARPNYSPETLQLS